MKKLLILNFLFTFAGISYNKSGLDITNGGAESFYAILIFISPLTLWALFVQYFDFKSKVKKFVSIIGFLFLIPYTWLTIYMGNKNYEDREILAIDPKNKKHKIIYQYMDEGAIGGHSRTIKVTEIIPGLRYIESITY